MEREKEREDRRTLIGLHDVNAREDPHARSSQHAILEEGEKIWTCQALRFTGCKKGDGLGREEGVDRLIQVGLSREGWMK